MLLCCRLWSSRPLDFIVGFRISPSEACTVFHLFVCVCFAHLSLFQLIWSEIILILKGVGHGVESKKRSFDCHDEVPYLLVLIGTLAVLLYIFDVQFWMSISAYIVQSISYTLVSARSIVPNWNGTIKGKESTTLILRVYCKERHIDWSSDDERKYSSTTMRGRWTLAPLTLKNRGKRLRHLNAFKIKELRSRYDLLL